MKFIRDNYLFTTRTHLVLTGLNQIIFIQTCDVKCQQQHVACLGCQCLSDR